MKNTEDIFRNADFSKGSKQKQQLYSVLFEKNSSQEVRSLSDDQLDTAVAAGSKRMLILPIRN